MRLFYLSILVFVCGQANAAELKLYDTRGVLRLIKEISSPVIIVTQIDIGDQVEARIVNTNGIAQEVVGVKLGDGNFEFNNISEGSWKLELSDKRALLKSLSIKQQQQR